MKTVQTNVRVAPEDQALIRSIAVRLRADPGFREKLAALLLRDQAGPELRERLERLEGQVAWLQSGAIVVPRTAPRPPVSLPPKGPSPPAGKKG